MASGLILLIEDDPYQQRLYTRALESAGYTVVVSGAGEQAARLCDLNGPRLVILDINLPGISGIETCKRIRLQYSVGVPVIFVTSTDKLEVMRECIEVGGDDFMVKGSNIKGYLERVGYWMGRRCLSPKERTSILEKVGSKLPRPNEPPPVDLGLVKQLNAFVAEAQGGAPAAPNVGSGTNTAAVTKLPRGIPRPVDLGLVDGMAAFVADARVGAPADFGKQASEKFVLLGYAAGVVNALANSNLEVKMRFVPHLRALLTATQLLSLKEIEASVDRWHTMYKVDVFASACQKGEEDYARRLEGMPEARPTPVAQLLAPT